MKFMEWRMLRETLMDYTPQNLDHYIGNPLFAIETNLFVLRNRISKGMTEKALETVDAIERSVNQAKEALSQIKANQPGATA